ncbi:MuF-C-terminal domain-containing protein [Chitinophaga rhizophila]|uniref:Phage MuF C-terminal domain-containing protein n=1 Tax=Chitinophaga rhizophila TaxID=2866212 RepID=A0ABS7GEG5_9BACT|nr:hypothetical protein [Chitinophaga rhizophila]MBW8686064.1 hypothetical protein [Chitinophaga rhizophila]
MHKPIRPTTPTTPKKEESVLKPSIKDICNIYNERLRIILNGTNTDYTPLELGRPCKHLISCGTPDLPIQISVRRLVDKKLQANHPFSLVSVVHMPEYLDDPIAIFQSKTRSDVKVVLTDMEEKGINFVVAIELRRIQGKQEINDVRSVYPKDNILDVLRWIAEDKLMEYCNKEKILNWLGKQQSNSVEVTKLIKDCTKVIEKL